MFIARGLYRIECISDVILPPLTSKVLKYIIEKYGPDILKELTSQRRAFKPIQISPLFIRDKPLYSRGEPIPPIARGTVLNAWISLVSNSLDPSILDISGTYNTPYGVIDVSLVEVEVVDVCKLSLDIDKYFKIEFLTPTVLTAKHMIPPPLKTRSRALPERHRLIPQPSFMFSYLLKFWNAIAKPEERIPSAAASNWEAYKLGRLADVTLVEVDYNIRPETVVVGRDSSGKLRRARGFVGWVIYEVLAKKLRDVYAKLLTLANYLGIGRSRGIGLGIVRIVPIEYRVKEQT